MRTIDINAAGGMEMEMSRTRFAALPYAPCKSAIANIERILRRRLGDYRKETPGTHHPLTPYQQWVLRFLHQEFISAHPRIRLNLIEEYIHKNRTKLSKENYEAHRNLNYSSRAC